jgi:hypothetical protein
MRRSVLAALSAIALMLVVSLGAIVALDRADRSEPPAPPPPQSVPPPGAAAVALPRPETPTGTPQPSTQPRGVEPPPAMALPTDPAQRLRALQPLQHEVRVGLDDLEVRSGCDLGEVMLALTLETRDREVRIVEAEARRRVVEPEVHAEIVEGEVDEAVARCVRDRVRGMVLWAPSARPGRRWETFYSPPRPRR